MRILLDHNIPRPLRNSLPGHDVDTTAERRWDELHNGELLDRAETEGYGLLITADQQMPFQQNFTNRGIRVLVLTNNSWPTLRQHLDEINQAVNATEHHQISRLDIQ